MTEMQPTAPAGFELRARVASGAVIVVAVIVAVSAGTMLFAAIATVAAIVALREWHRLVSGGGAAREIVPSALAIIGGVLLVHLHVPILWSLAIIAAGAMLVALSAALRGAWVSWHAAGLIYVGVPFLALVLLREDQHQGGAIVGGVFAAVWAADTGALFIGRLIGGPRLAPQLSPNKTWAGFIGGVLAAGIAEAAYVWLFGGVLVLGALFGVFLGIAAHVGDLFESWVKRQFRAKNTGALIPGHGGILDRIDSLLVAAPAAAALLFLTDIDMFGALP